MTRPLRTTTTRALPDESDPAIAGAGVTAPRRSWRIAQTVLALVLIGFAAWYLWRQWRDASAARLDVTVRWGWLAAASAIVLFTYVFLIEIWRRVLARFGAAVSFRDASRIWFVSNLGKYVPGKIWQVTTMAAMLNGVGIGFGVAARASALITIANVAAGFALLLAVGAPAMRALGERLQLGVWLVVVVLLVVLLLAPVIMRGVARVARGVMRAGTAEPTMPVSATILSVVGCFVAWLLYGVAFRFFVVAVLGTAPAAWSNYIAAYVLSYLVGYLVIVAPGGLGPREATLSALLVALRMTTPAEAAVITIASRLWLSALEVLPGIGFLAHRSRR